MTSPASSRSSSRSSGTPGPKHDEKIAQMTESMMAEFKQEMFASLQEKLQDQSDHKESIEKGMEEIKNYMTAQAAGKNSEIVKALQQQHQEAQEKIIGENTKVKEEMKKSLLKAVEENFSGEWRPIASEHIEEITDELELNLWNQMSSTLQEVYRMYRNTANNLKVNKQTSIDVMDDRLMSTLMHVHVTNLERVQCLKKSAQEYLREEIRRRDEDLRMVLELEAKTLQREIEQIKHNAEANVSKSRSLLCILL